ncbi:Hsp33 family molecular chaperone HslO [Herbaspirillum sp. RTI4]|uniref:Hsp33 family molecular chaperone HslO n=1 Tax=Herbaspirillum sp. RTI4 TaxID=3048640 RepID=UPI002AB44EEA|nr:Hsp33 family molecular chaperone HslO [Herbaspirillum sp. RTI4]MDY7578447.1 Hsp33 family molecular chaperone HslO [Herbaspirillum sp. RTI4]MEA9982539.1 Hsp33 family molecular chaperone HslO [Herbaspirillum sp. RTI4]
MKDTLQKFMFDQAPVRGELVELVHTWQQVQAHHEYPHAVRKMLGEMMSAAALLSANIKFNGVIVMQIHGDGPVRLLVVECDADLRMRATAKLSEDTVAADIAADASLPQLVNQHGKGRFVITLDPKDKMPGQQAYQGIVPLDGETVAEVIENYMLRSEQLDTKLWLAADGNVSRGLLLQKLPANGGKDAPVDEADSWNRLALLGDTLREEELLSTDIATLLHRLFWEETVRVFDPLHPEFYCTCSREKVGDMLRMLGQDEIDSAIAELGHLSIDCEFCRQHYEFDKVDCAQLFADAAALPEGIAGSSTILH